jgi:gliding motility-associated-like protein
VNCAYYVNNCGCVAPNCIQYDGFTVPVTVTLNVCPCQTYHWKFIIADALDHAFDSGIFLDYLNSCGSPLQYNITPVAAVCGCNGQATVNVTQGTPPYNYLWSDGQTTQTAVGLCPGVYTVSVTDAISCNSVVTQQVVITGSPSPVVVSLTSQVDEPCFGDTVGSAIINPTGGLGPYSYQWSTSPPQVTQNAWNLAAGNYSVIVTDVNGCADTLQVTINEPPQLNIAFNNFTHTTCNNPNGSISPTYTGGTGAYTYSWSSGPGTASINNLSPGNYTVTVTDANNCSTSASFMINPSTVPVISASPDVTICFGQNTTLTANGAPFYSWSPSTGLSSPTGSPVTANPTTSTLYQVIGMDSVGCTDTAFVNVTVNPLPVMTVTPQAVAICDGETTPLSAGGANTYTWSPATGLSSTTGTPVNANPNTTTVYTVVGDLLGCLDSATVTVTVNPMPITAYAPLFTDGCSPVNVQFNDASPFVPAGSSYYWDFGNGNNSNLQNPAVIFTQPGNYTVTLTITAPGGCTSSFSNSAVHVYANPVANFAIAPLSSFIGRVVSFYDQTLPAGATWSWTFGDPPGGSSTQQNPTYTYNDTGTFVITLVVTTADGCIDSTSSTILIRDFEYALWVPNTFTPNADGVNDIFITQGIGIEKFEMTIYDRWGLPLFRTNNWGDGWNGRMNDSGEMCQMGVYVYTIKAWDVNMKVHHYVGKVTLLR